MNFVGVFHVGIILSSVKNETKGKAALVRKQENEVGKTKDRIKTEERT